MAVLVNLRDCNTQRLGTGVIDCLIELNAEPLGYFLVDRSWSLTIADPNTFDQTYLLARIQDESFVPFLNKINFTDNSEDTVFETFDSGVKSRVRAGYPEYAFDFDKGLYFHQAAHSYVTFQAYNIVLALTDGTLLFAETEDGLSITGFQAGYVDAATFRFQTGSTVQRTMTAFQLTNAEQFNSRASALLSSQSGVDITQINGVIDVVLTATAPAATETALVFTARAAANEEIDILGITDADLRLLGATNTISDVAYDANTRQYTITVGTAFTAAEEYTVQLYDSAFTPNAVPAVNIAGEIYKGTSNTVTVTP